MKYTIPITGVIFPSSTLQKQHKVATPVCGEASYDLWDNASKMKVLVLKGSSFVSFHLAQRLVKLGHQVTVARSANMSASTKYSYNEEVLCHLRWSEMKRQVSKNWIFIEIGKMCEMEMNIYTHVVFIIEDEPSAYYSNLARIWSSEVQQCA